MASELDLRITATAMAIGSAITTKRFYTKFDVLEPPRELTGAGRERFKEAQRNKRRAHYEACAKAEREFVEGELRRVAAAGVGALHEVLNNWTPTPENINALPEPIRRYIHDVETRCDPTGLVQENTVLKDSVAALETKVEELERDFDDAIERICGMPADTLARVVDGLLAKVETEAEVRAVRGEADEVIAKFLGRHKRANGRYVKEK